MELATKINWNILLGSMECFYLCESFSRMKTHFVSSYSICHYGEDYIMKIFARTIVRSL